MARWTGTWLTGLGSAGVTIRDEADYRGRRLGLPEQGPGSLAPFGVRLGAFGLDVLLAGLLGALVNSFGSEPSNLQRNVVATVAFVVLTAVTLIAGARTPGMRALGLRVRSLPVDAARLGPLPALVRTVVLSTFVLALVADRDGRGLHDRLAGTAVVRQ